jgi:site-specific recombinase
MNAPQTTLSERTALLASVMASDCTAAIGVIEQLIADGGESADVCVLLKRCIATVGCLADALTQAHGGPPVVGGARDWLCQSAAVQEAYLGLSKRGGAA